MLVFPKRCLGKILNKLEDSSYPIVGPHLRLLGFVGLWHPDMTLLSARLKKYFFFITITFFFTQYVKCIISLNPDDLKLILQYAPFHMGILKACLFQKHYKKWKDLINYTASVELNQLSLSDQTLNDIIKDYIKRSRRITYFFWALVFINFSIFSEPYQKNYEVINGTSVYNKIFNGYTPFYQESPPGYYISMGIQTLLGQLVSAYVVGWDTLVVSLMIFFAGQLKVTRLYCVSLIKNDTDSHKNIAHCHKFYANLIQNQRLFNSLISPVMFVYLINISVNLGLCIIQITEIHNDLATLISSCLFVLACLIQLLIFYHHSNEVTLESSKVSYSAFKSDWTNVDQRLLREIHLLAITTRTRLVFKAGPFNEMSLATFISILRTSYSFYTLLSKTP